MEKKRFRKTIREFGLKLLKSRSAMIAVIAAEVRLLHPKVDMSVNPLDQKWVYGLYYAAKDCQDYEGTFRKAAGPLQGGT